MDVEHAAALRVGQRAHTVAAPRGVRAPPSTGRFRAGSRAGSRSGSETSASAPARSGVRTSPTASPGRPASSSAGRSTWSTSAVTVAQRGAAGAQDDGVAALQHLRGDVGGDVRPRLEVRTDVPTGTRRSETSRPFGEPPGADVAVERREQRGRLEPATIVLDARVVEAQAVESACVERRPPRPTTSSALAASTALRRSRTRRRRRAGPPRPRRPRRRGAPAWRRLPRPATRRRHGVVGGHALGRFTLYCSCHRAGDPRSASREVEGTGPMTPRQPAPSEHGAKPAEPRGSDDGEREKTKGDAYASHPPPLYTVRHRDRTRGVVSACERCFAPLEPVYDPDVVRREADPRSGSRPARRRCGGTRRCCPSQAPPEALLAPGFTPLVAAPRLADELGVGELYLKLDTANPTHSFKDRVVAVASAKAQELGLEALACASTGNLANAVAARAAVEGLAAAVFCPADVEREKLLASAAHGATIYAVRGNYDACSRLTSRARPSSCRGPSSTSTSAPTTPRARRRSRTRSSSSSAGSCRTSVVSPDRLGLAAPRRSSAGFRGLPRARARRRAQPPRLIGSQADGCSPVATAFAEGRHVQPVRPDTVARLARDREPGRRRRRDRGGARVAAAPSTPWPRTRSARTCCCSRRPPASSARRRPASRSARCARRSRSGDVGPRRPGRAVRDRRRARRRSSPSADRFAPVEIDAGRRRAAGGAGSRGLTSRENRWQQIRQPTQHSAIFASSSRRTTSPWSTSSTGASISSREIKQRKSELGVGLRRSGARGLVARLPARREHGPAQRRRAARAPDDGARPHQARARRAAVRIASLPGDGIGPEVCDAAVRVLDALPIDVAVEEHPFGAAPSTSTATRCLPRRWRPAAPRTQSSSARPASPSSTARPCGPSRA